MRKFLMMLAMLVGVGICNAQESKKEPYYFMGINVDNLEYDVDAKYGEGVYKYVNRFYSPDMIRDYYYDLQDLIDEVNDKEDYAKFLIGIENGNLIGYTIDEIEDMAGEPNTEYTETDESGEYIILEYPVTKKQIVQIYFKENKVISTSYLKIK